MEVCSKCGYIYCECSEDPERDRPVLPEEYGSDYVEPEWDKDE